MSSSYLILLVLAVIASVATLATANSCTPTNKSCDFYLGCLEKVKPCGATGYAVGYGNKYCNKFSSKTFHSQSAVNWLNAAKKCLQQTLVPIIKNPNAYTCSQIVDIAFNSHPQCYTQSVASICSIRDVRDLTSILFTVDGKDLFSLRSGKQIKDVISICTHQILNLSEEMSDEEFDFMRQPGEASMNKLRRFWLGAARIAKAKI